MELRIIRIFYLVDLKTECISWAALVNIWAIGFVQAFKRDQLVAYPTGGLIFMT